MWMKRDDTEGRFSTMTQSGTNAKLWIKGCRVIDPVNRVDETRDVYVEDGVYVEEPGAGFRESATCIDAGGLCLAPSLTDLQVHLREPGITLGRRFWLGLLSVLPIEWLL